MGEAARRRSAGTYPNVTDGKKRRAAKVSSEWRDRLNADFAKMTKGKFFGIERTTDDPRLRGVRIGDK